MCGRDELIFLQVKGDKYDFYVRMQELTEYQRHGIIMGQLSHEICKYCNQIVLDSAAPYENKEICQWE